MIYINDNDVKNLNLNWNKNIQMIAEATQCIEEKDMAQPIKPYLRYRDIKNRIIAMPAFVGGPINKSGIKWIASFPDNIQKGIPRAHSVIILNEAETGLPVGIVNSGSISAIRTASVSGLMIKHYIKNRNLDKIKLGIVGFGPIGRYHLNMCNALLGENLDEVLLYDLADIDTSSIGDDIHGKITVTNSWEEAYLDADIFITCTVSKERYIDKKPKDGSLHLNVSLRDYKPEVFPWFEKSIIVDDWEEVCRENTDIEMFHKNMGLQEENVAAIQDIIVNDYISSLPADQPIMFNPMGMAVFDIAIANHYLRLAEEMSQGVVLDN